MNHEMNPIETDDDVEQASVAALFDEQSDDPMHEKPSKDDRANYGSDTDVMLPIADSKIKNLIAEEVDLVYADCSHADVQAQMDETLVDMLHVGNSATSN